MTKHAVFAVPGDLATRTGGYAYDRRMIAELRDLGWHIRHLALPGGFPEPGDDELERTAQAFAAIEAGTTVLVDGLAFGAMPQIAERESRRLDLVALVHHPLALEGDRRGAQALRLRESERRALAHVRAAIVTSPATARDLVRDYGVAPERIAVAVPGTEPASRSPATGEPPVILTVGTLTARKGHDILVAALARIADRPWRARIVGSGDRQSGVREALARQIEAVGLAERVVLTGEVADLDAEWRRADLFVLATRHEGFGMVFAEAMAHGLPVIGTAVGAVPDLVPAEAGLLVPAGDPAALARALGTLIADPVRRRALGEGAFAAARRLPTWRQSAAVISNVLEGAP